jgi:hypothetical protein
MQSLMNFVGVLAPEGGWKRVSLGFGAREANASVEFLWMFVRLAPKGELQVLMISWSLWTRR